MLRPPRNAAAWARCRVRCPVLGWARPAAGQAAFGLPAGVSGCGPSVSCGSPAGAARRPKARLSSSSISFFMVHPPLRPKPRVFCARGAARACTLLCAARRRCLGFIIPHSRNPSIAFWPGPVKGAASVPPGSSFACARIYQVDTLYHICRAHAALRLAGGGRAAVVPPGRYIIPHFSQGAEKSRLAHFDAKDAGGGAASYLAEQFTRKRPACAGGGHGTRRRGRA